MNSKSDNNNGVEWKGEEKEFIQSNLAFFGRMSANISHDLKNRLATINEKAGLLEDLVGLAENGSHPLELDRVRKLAKDVSRQVAIADEACLRLNRFAHSADFPKKREDILELLSLIAALIHHQANIAGINVTIGSCPNLQFETNPFLLQLVIYTCLIWAMDHCPSGTLTLKAEQSDKGIRITIKGADFDGLLKQPPIHLSRALQLLGANLAQDDNNEEVIILH